jgi:hypothetical protein
MELATFSQQNTVYAKDQPQYRPLPCYRYPNDPSGRIACCWSLSWRERFRVFLSGRIWHQVLTFNSPLQPHLLTVERPDFGATEHQNVQPLDNAEENSPK